MSIFLYIIDTLKDFIVTCEMDDFLVFWELFYSSHEFWHLQPFHVKKLEGKIAEAKLACLDPKVILDRLKNLKEGIKKIRISDEIMDLLHQEYLSNHNNIVDVLNNINQLVETGDNF